MGLVVFHLIRLADRPRSTFCRGGDESIAIVDEIHGLQRTHGWVSTQY